MVRLGCVKLNFYRLYEEYMFQVDILVSINGKIHNKYIKICKSFVYDKWSDEIEESTNVTCANLVSLKYIMRIA